MRKKQKVNIEFITIGKIIIASTLIMIPYTQQTIDDADIEAVTLSLKNPVITRGPKVKEFEQSLCDYTGATYAVCFNSGSTALLGAYHALKVNSADKIYTSPITFIGTIAGGLSLGASPVFLDIDPLTGNIALDALEPIQLESTRGKAIFVPVHYAGCPIDMQVFQTKTLGINSHIIEDACCALGANYPSGEKVGSCAYSDLTVFSFHPAKTICTGEGGAVTTNHKGLYERLLLFRNNGIVRGDISDMAPWPYHVSAIANNYNFTDFQAALGISQLKKIDSFIQKRRQIASWYQKRLSRLPAIILPKQPENICSFNLFFIQFATQKYKREKATIMEKLKKAGIETRIHYIPLYQHQALVDRFGEMAESFPNAEAFYNASLSLPMFCDLKEEDIARICYTLKNILKRIR